MRNSLAVLLLAGACCLAFPRAAKADVYTITGVSYYEPTNSMVAYAEILPDYDTLAYYCVDYWGEVRKNDEVITPYWGGSCDSQLFYDQYFPYDPSADYTNEVHPQLIVKHWYPSPGSGYSDYYNYEEWAYGDSVYAPYYANFFGPGPEVPINQGSIILGAISSIFTEGAMAGPPDHLQVISDRTIIRADISCHPANKLIDFKLVDANNRRAGRVSLDEKPQSVTDTCSGLQVRLNVCSAIGVDVYGSFTDSLRTGCPESGSPPPGCGATFGNTWRRCEGRPPVTYSWNLAWMLYNLRHEYVEVDGERDMTDGQYKYP